MKYRVYKTEGEHLYYEDCQEVLTLEQVLARFEHVNKKENTYLPELSLEIQPIDENLFIRIFDEKSQVLSDSQFEVVIDRFELDGFEIWKLQNGEVLRFTDRLLKPLRKVF